MRALVARFDKWLAAASRRLQPPEIGAEFVARDGRQATVREIRGHLAALVVVEWAKPDPRRPETVFGVGEFWETFKAQNSEGGAR